MKRLKLTRMLVLSGIIFFGSLHGIGGSGLLGGTSEIVNNA